MMSQASKDPTLEVSVPTLRDAIAANWWILLLRGVLLVVIGLYALFNPGLAVTTWAIVLGCFLMADGVLAIIAGIAGWVESRGWVILRGVLAILAGAFAASHPALFGPAAAMMVVFVIAGWSIFGGILEIVVAIKERKAIEGEGWMILDGVFSILFGVVLAMAPLFFAGVLIRVTGVFAILFGCVAIYSSFQLRKLKTP